MNEIILVGRFQPFTNGHLAAYNYLCNKYAKVSIGVVDRKIKDLNTKNPFNTELRVDLIKATLPDVDVYVVPSLYWEHVHESVGHEVAIAVGADREKAILAMGGGEKFNYCVVPRETTDVSATEIRKAFESHGSYRDMKYFGENMSPTDGMPIPFLFDLLNKHYCLAKVIEHREIGELRIVPRVGRKGIYELTDIDIVEGTLLFIVKNLSDNKLSSFILHTYKMLSTPTAREIAQVIG